MFDHLSERNRPFESSSVSEKDAQNLLLTHFLYFRESVDRTFTHKPRNFFGIIGNNGVFGHAHAVNRLLVLRAIKEQRRTGFYLPCGGETEICFADTISKRMLAGG